MPGSPLSPWSNGAARRSGSSRQSPYDELKGAILHGRLAPGQPLVETTLAGWLEVSRTPIRAALNRLEQDGLVVRGDRGLVVRERSPEEILDIYEARIALEETVGRMAADRRSAYDLRILDRLVEQSVDVADDDEARARANAQFHRAIWRASHNEALIDLLERVNLQLGRYPATTLSYPGRWPQAIDEHRALVEAIERRDGERAREISFAHFAEARDIRLKIWDEDPFALGPPADEG